MGNLDGKMALVAGGTRGAGRGIAIEPGVAGAHVYGLFDYAAATDSGPIPVPRHHYVKEL
jgi:NAD(P)-dependent dehydrogenase (short-subunit alcohol dehydrogenase family)